MTTRKSPPAKPETAWAVVDPDGSMLWWDSASKKLAESLMVVAAFGALDSRDDDKKARAIEAAYAVGYRCIPVDIIPRNP